ncbi:MAG: DUF4338 domain-containing protein [Desulfobacteraceae bacterium]|nr:DUF4338 domain-containing protein [Desulfobacteraceae bacterium]
MSLVPRHITKKTISLEERVTLLLIRDLVRIGWRLKSNGSKSFELEPPTYYDKNTIKNAMAFSRNEIIESNIAWIKNNIELGRSNLASGSDVLKSKIIPRIEICKTQKQNDIFRLFRYYWSSSASDYVGRRMRFLIRDDGIKGSPIIGLAAIGSSIIHIPERDKWIGWNTSTRSDRIIFMMDAYVIGAMPPYNFLLGGKLVSYMLASNEVRSLYKEKYKKAQTLIKKRKASDLVLIMTSSLYGHNSSQYNRLKFGKTLLYKPIGMTTGYGSLHMSGETFEAMRELAAANGCNTSNRFGMGPNWRMRIIRSACDILNLNSDIILKHSFQRGLFAIPLAINYKSFLQKKTKNPIYRNLPLAKLVNFWRKRWLTMRLKNDLITQRVKLFSPEQFTIEKTKIDTYD